MSEPNSRSARGASDAGSAPQQQRPPDPTATEVSSVVQELLAKIERWPAAFQHRVLRSAASALGLDQQQRGGNTQQRRS